MNITVVLPAIITVTGLYLMFKLKFFFILHPIRTVKCFLGSMSDRGARRAFCLALAGTLGVGNIFGVAAGIMIGGAGSVFWLFISSFFSMIIKYAETYMVCDNVTDRGGMAGALTKLFKKNGKAFSLFYAFMTVVLALFMGAAIQSVALLDVAEKAVGLSSDIGGAILLLLFIPCLVFGTGKIENITEILIPLTTILYILVCLAAILLNFNGLIPTITMIIKSAFSIRAIGGGVFIVAIKEGFARGMLSNEAGMGTSALAHSKIKHKSGISAGVFGMYEVFFDTTLLCTLTAITILVSVDNLGSFTTPMSLVYTAFTNTLGRPFGYVLFAMVFAFAYSTVICWYYYGYECVRIYFPRIKPIYMIGFSAFILFSSLISQGILLYITDITMLTLSLITIISILKYVNKIKIP